MHIFFSNKCIFSLSTRRDINLKILLKMQSKARSSIRRRFASILILNIQLKTSMRKYIFKRLKKILVLEDDSQKIFFFQKWIDTFRSNPGFITHALPTISQY